MQIIELNINELKPYKNNAKIHTDEQIEQIVNSIEKFGMNDPVGVWGEENLIVEGHGRLLALKKMGKDTVPCIRLDHLTEEQRKAYTLAHNKLTMNTDFDFEMLEKELQDIEMDMSDFGFDLGIELTDEYGEDFELPDGEQGEIRTMTLTLHKNQLEFIQYAISQIEETETFGNTNKTGNKVYEVFKQWAEQKR